MNVLAVTKNILTKGPIKTYNIYKKREHERLKAQLKQAVIRGFSETEVSFLEQKGTYDAYIDAFTEGNITEKKYNEELKNICIKNVYPYVYNKEFEKPITNKVIFLQLEEMSPGCEYIYNTVKETGKYEVVLCELHKDEVSALDFYENAKYFVREMAMAQTVFVDESNDLMKELNIRQETEIIKLWQDYRNYAEYIESLTDGNLTEKKYNRELKRIYIKNVYPSVYNEEIKKPITNKAIFMQPRAGLNQSCRYMYNKLKETGKYEVKLCEFHRGKVSTLKYYENGKKFIREMATAKGVFVHESNDLIGHLNIRQETKIIQLWHGCGVFKKIGLSTSGKEHFKSQKTYEEYPEYNKYSIVTIASPELSWVFEEFMGIKKEEGIIQPIGVSRTDEFFEEGYVKRCFETLYEVIPAAKEKKVILYAPTYRGLNEERVSPDKLDVKKFAEALGDEYILIFKHHQTAINLPEIPEPYKDTFAYDMTRGKGMTINDLMTVADICISDYSSLVFEYALFERPMLFYVYDLEQYIDNRGLYYDFDEITPGPLCKTNEEMIDYILHVDEKFNKQEVTDFKNKFMCSCDGHATERIIEFMEK